MRSYARSIALGCALLLAACGGAPAGGGLPGQIAFVSDRTGGRQIFVVRPDRSRLAQITPGRLQKTFFGNSGAEGIETAMRLAKAYTGKREIISLTHSFHGRTAGTLSITGTKARKTNGGPYLAGVAFAPPAAQRQQVSPDTV